MRIAQVVSTFPPYMAGTGNVCYYNSLELARLGHDVTVFTSRYSEGDFKYPESIKVVRFKPLLRIGNAPLIPRLATIERFDIVHLHFPFVFGAELILLNSILKKNSLIVTSHQDMDFDGVLHYLAKGYNAVVGTRVLSRARKILAPSLDYLANSYFKSLMETRKEDVLEVPNGVDIDRFHAGIDSTPLRARHDLQDKQVVLFVGALDKAHFFKGVDVLIEAFRRVKTPNGMLMIVGDGDLKRNYQRLAEDLGLSQRVIFTGSVLNWDLPQYYALGDILVLPSTGVETFGMVLIEAMACGKPVIASNLPGVRTVVDDGINGLLVTPGDIDGLAAKMQRLLASQDMRAAFGKEARRKVEAKYSWREIGERLEKIYQDTLSETAG